MLYEINLVIPNLPCCAVLIQCIITQPTFCAGCSTIITVVLILNGYLSMFVGHIGFTDNLKRCHVKPNTKGIAITALTKFIGWLNHVIWNLPFPRWGLAALILLKQGLLKGKGLWGPKGPCIARCNFVELALLQMLSTNPTWVAGI